jgi:putative glutamine amidotransferase
MPAVGIVHGITPGGAVMTLLVGIPACSKDIGGLLQHATPARYGAAVMGGAGALPILLPPVGEGLVAMLDRLDGLVLSGSPSNVEPRNYGIDDDLTPDLHDPHRDATTLPLIRAAVARGLPVLAICRGIQELNVALGGTLIQQVQALPGRMDHRAITSEAERTEPLDFNHLFRLKHEVAVTGQLARIVGGGRIRVNSLHQQAIDRPAASLVVEARADDGTIEAVRAPDAPGFVLGVQWHPEWHYLEDAPSLAIFRAFGDACRAYGRGLKRAA